MKRIIATLMVCSLILFGITGNAQPSNAQSSLEFPFTLSADIPHDVDNNKLNELINVATNKDKNGSKQQELAFAKIQQLFDIDSWQTFLALNWPLDDSGKPLSKITDKGNPQWETWKESTEVFLPDGSAPAPWGTARNVPTKCDIQKSADNTRLLSLTSSVGSIPNDVNEVNEAFTYPLWDQNGNKARYEIFLNEDEFNYIVSPAYGYELYNLDGQIKYAKDHGGSKAKLKFPSGKNGTDTVGAIELKLAWKVMGKGDKTKRFYTQDAYIIDENEDGTVSSCTKEKVGLVGMHIAHKTKSSPQWIWSTFEQIDNVRVNALDPHAPVQPSFYNLQKRTLPVNVCPGTLNGSQCMNDNNTPTQVTRVIPIPKEKEVLNRQIQKGLKAKNSVWQYYELIDTQWPTNPPKAPTKPGDLPNSILNKSGGFPTPVYLTNSVMETYFQLGNQPACQEEEGGCLENKNDTTQVFGTESCMGCHSSAGLASSGNQKNGAKFNPQLSSDFSWLLQQKAHWAKQVAQAISDSN